MGKVTDCVHHLRDLFHAFCLEDFDLISQKAQVIFRLEHEANLVKYDIRRDLVRRFFMPIDRVDVLEVIQTQDRLADLSAQIGSMMMRYPLSIPSSLRQPLQRLFHSGMNTFEKVNEITQELDTCLKLGFNKLREEHIKMLVSEVTYLQHECSLIQGNLTQELFFHGEEFSHVTFYLWVSLLELLGKLPQRSGHLAQRIYAALDVL